MLPTPERLFLALHHSVVGGGEGEVTIIVAVGLKLHSLEHEVPRLILGVEGALHDGDVRGEGVDELEHVLPPVASCR